MPVERVKSTQLQSAVECVNDFIADERSRGRPSSEDWSLDTLQRRIDAGARVWVYAAAAQGGRVDGVCCYQLKQMIAPDAKRESLWMNIVELIVRPSRVAPANRIRTMFLAARGAFPEAIIHGGAIGVTAEFLKENVELQTFMQTWDGVQWEDTATHWRFWIRATADLRIFTARTRQIGADSPDV